MNEHEDILGPNTNALQDRIEELEITVQSSVKEIAYLHDRIKVLQANPIATMQNANHSDDLSYDKLENMRLTGSDFSGHSMGGISLCSASAINCGFHKAFMSDSDLSFGTFGYCDFSDAYLNNSRLMESRFKDCDFRYAILDHADLSGASFIDCDFLFASLARSVLTGTRFKGCSFTMTPAGSALSEEQLESGLFENCTGLEN